MPLTFLLRHLLVGNLHLEPLNVLFFSQSGYTELSGGSVFTNSALLAVTELLTTFGDNCHSGPGKTESHRVDLGQGVSDTCP